VPSSIPIGKRDVLVVIDMETDFTPGGPPRVGGDDAIAPLVNRLARAFENVVLTQGLRPKGDGAIPPSQPDTGPFDGGLAAYAHEARLPDHCGQGEPGAELRAGLDFERAFLILSKGAGGEVETLSASSDADGEAAMNLANLLKARGIRRVFACGLVTDYCVARLMLDARAAGLETFVIDDACRAIDASGSFAGAWATMNSAQVWRIRAREILG
jgi:nicotinamidase/pyrazinamidase